MAGGLKRDLGLFSVMAISIGAMVGSGIFILPALAFKIAGPTMLLAFLLAGLLVLPAALSKIEMATAMPQDGGTYLYIERGMGPLFGTIAGVGTWFSLSFKGALALVGGVPYLIYLLGGELPVSIRIVAITIAIVLIVLNLVGSDVTGRFQVGIVVVMLAAMSVFVVAGLPAVESSRLSGAFDPRSSGTLSLLEATGAVYVAYAGVTKIASVAEEIENPSRNIPIGMLGSLLFTGALYVLTVYVLLGVLPVNAAGGLGTITTAGAEDAVVAQAGELLLGTPGVAIVTIAVTLALVSTANAGILSASRYPFAMARDNLAPPSLTTISERFNTPSRAVMLTGAVILLMIAIFPILQIAKLASAFKILVFVLINIALIGFREGAVEEYNPTWIAPLYPWVQLFGIVAGLVLLSQMGTVPIVGAIVIIAGSLLWYYTYVRSRVTREGAATDAVRRNVGDDAVARTRELFDTDAELDVLVALTERTSDRTKRGMLRIATDLGRLRTTTVALVEFLNIPHRVFAQDHAEIQVRDPPEWLQSGADRPDWLPDVEVGQPTRTSGGVRVGDTGEDLPTTRGTRIEHREIDSEDHKRAIVDVATYEGYDLLVLERDRGDFHRRILGDETGWILKNAPCDTVLVEDRGFEGADEIAVVANRGAYDPLKLLIADAVAEETGAEINLIQVIPEDPPETQRRTVEEYHTALISITTVPTRSTILEADDDVAAAARFAQPADLVITGVDTPGFLGRFRGRPGNRLVESVDCTALMVQTADRSGSRSPIKRVLMERLFS
ncbi:amino acid permease [Halalkalirubrum salinum]|uniref:amino acid permease n=1 Tax=Halalkalirubrum salinum TaxID=2563889 RepID=UPI0010FB8B70|nr:universal stress protein [Halalkalirubrum salinum]